MYSSKNQVLHLTREYIFARISEADVFEFYLGIPVQFDTAFCSPLRTDAHPTCRYFVHRDGSVHYVDYAWRSFSAIQLVRYLHCDCNYYQALEIIAQQFNLKHTPAITSLIDQRKARTTLGTIQSYIPINIRRKNWTQTELNFWQLPELKISVEQLEAHQIFSISDVWFHGMHTLQNLRNQFAFKLKSPDGFQIYNPFSQTRDLRFRASTTSWVAGTPWLKQSKFVVVTKSYKDWFYLRQAGVNACTVLSESKVLTQQELGFLRKFGEPVIFYDNDKTGREMAARRSEEYDCPYLLLPGKAEDGMPKDFTDFCQENGFETGQDWLSCNQLI